MFNVCDYYKSEVFLSALSGVTQMNMGSLMTLASLKASSLCCFRKFFLTIITSGLLREL